MEIPIKVLRALIPRNATIYFLYHLLLCFKFLLLPLFLCFLLKQTPCPLDTVKYMVCLTPGGRQNNKSLPPRLHFKLFAGQCCCMNAHMVFKPR